MKTADNEKVKKISFISGYSQETRNMLNLKVLTSGHVILEPGYRHQGFLSLNRMQIIIQGEGTAYINGKKQDLKAGNVYIFPLLNNVELYNEGVLEKIYGQFNLNYFSLDIFNNEKDVLVKKFDPLMIERYKSILKKGSLFHAKSLMYEILDLFSDTLDKIIRQKSSLYHRFREFFKICEEQNPLHVPVSRIARMMNMNEAYFTRIFKKKFSQTPKNYMILQKMNKAKEFLVFSDISMRDISEQLGFTDQFHFCKTFKKNENISPSRFRDKMKNMYA
ncbi:MAG: hypothetical protein A2096_09810 [Spirochaetes bacterium GWF1_41_5]|nr:MAG: hypothetical protein A2096_09810 [Spirochaetes bacterium GWF1_41_5]